MLFRGGECVRTSQSDKFGSAQQTVVGRTLSVSLRALSGALSATYPAVLFFFLSLLCNRSMSGQVSKLGDDTGVM